MSNYIHLIGVEDVNRAGHTIRSAAESMQSAASSIEESLRQHRVWADEWLARLEKAIGQMPHNQ